MNYEGAPEGTLTPAGRPQRAGASRRSLRRYVFSIEFSMQLQVRHPAPCHLLTSLCELAHCSPRQTHMSCPHIHCSHCSSSPAFFLPCSTRFGHPSSTCCRRINGRTGLTFFDVRPQPDGCGGRASLRRYVRSPTYPHDPLVIVGHFCEPSHAI